MISGRIIKRSGFFIAMIGIGWLAIYLWNAFPIISGFGAKNLCSCVFVTGRDPQNVIKEELGEFPLSLGSYSINRKDSSASASVWGMARKKAIYRKGLGCTLINDISEEALRAQEYSINQQTVPGGLDTVPWPLGEKIAVSVPPGADTELLEKAAADAFVEADPNHLLKTKAVLVVYKGQIVYEKYGEGINKDSKLLGWSVAKSFASTLVGTLVRGGKLDIHQPAPVPEWNDPKDPRHGITIENLLQQTSGLDFTEDYESNSEVTRMLFKNGDMEAFAATRELKYKPGTVFNYNSGNSNILSGIVRRTVGEKDYLNFPAAALFYRLGMYNTLLEPDVSGTYVLSSYIYATARDFARFGLLYLNNGVFNGEQILPAEWVKKSAAPPEADPLKHYGYQFWLNGFDQNDLSTRWYPDVPADMFFADGYGGQDVYIIPSRKVVIVRLGLHVLPDENEFISGILRALK